MKSIDLRRKAAEKLDAATKIISAAADGMTDEQVSEVEKLKAESDSLIRQAELAESVESSVAGMDLPATNAPRSFSAHDRVQDDPNRGFPTMKHFLSAITDKALKGKSDDRLKMLAAGGDDHHTQDNQRGGYLLPPGFSAQLLKTDAPNDPIGTRTRRVPIGPNTNSIEIPARVDKNHSTSVSGGLTVSRRTETQAITASQMALEKVKLELHSLAGAAYASEELLSQSPISIVSLLSDGFGDEFASNRISEVLGGTGVGQYEGINNSPALITVDKETSQAQDTIVYANIVKMYARLWGKSNAIWLYNDDCLPQLMTMTDASGKLIWSFSAREGEPDMLLGRPAFATEYAETVGDAGDIYLLNLREYLEADRGTIDQAESIHVRFLENEHTFRFLKYNDGRSWWRSVLTPKNGATLSPFVRLAARA